MKQKSELGSMSCFDLLGSLSMCNFSMSSCDAVVVAVAVVVLVAVAGIEDVVVPFAFVG
jgi:hypothetical protein